MGVENNAVIICVIGSSGSGKSTWIKQQIKKQKPSRLIIMDPKSEYGDFVKLHRTVGPIATATKQKSFAVGYRFPTRQEIESGEKTVTREQGIKAFSELCKIAYVRGNCWIVIDELSLFTTAGWAPSEWQDCTMRGRHEGLTVIGASQRPAKIDKDFFDNASFVRTGRLNEANSLKTMANVLHVDHVRISRLKPFEYLSRDMNTGEVLGGVISLK